MNTDSPFDKMLAQNPVLAMGFEAVKRADETAAQLACSYWNDGYLRGQIDATNAITASMMKKAAA